MTGEPVTVFRGNHHHHADLFGPLPGRRLGNVVAYEFELPDTYFEPWPGRTLLERTFVLLDLGVSFADVCWGAYHMPDGILVSNGDAPVWYVDLVTIEQTAENSFTILDLYIDVMVPTDGRHYRMLDLDEFADAIDAGTLDTEQTVSALRRWQTFLDRHLHADRYPASDWTDFPPAEIEPLRTWPEPFGPVVRWEPS